MRTTHLLNVSLVALLAACSNGDPAAITAATADATMKFAGGSAPDISGTWTYSERTFLVLKPEEDVLHLSCVSPDGILTIVQDGADFTGTLTHPNTVCQTKDGIPVPPPWPLPYHATLSGRITGRAIHIEQFDALPGSPVRCTKHGALTLNDAGPVAISTTGRCDLSFMPFPLMARNDATGVRP